MAASPVTPPPDETASAFEFLSRNWTAVVAALGGAWGAAVWRGTSRARLDAIEHRIDRLEMTLGEFRKEVRDDLRELLGQR